MKFLLCRHTEAEKGEPMDVTRTLTDTGKKEIPILIKFLKSVTEDIGLIVCSDMRRGIDTAEPIGEALDVEVIRSPWVGPEVEPERAWKEIVKLTKSVPSDEMALVVSHGKLVNKLAAWLLESGEGDKFHFIHGAIAKFDTKEPDHYGPYNGGYKGQPAFLHWMVTPKLLKRVQQDNPNAVIEAALKVADVTLESLSARFDEAKGAYYYDTEGVKRWVLGDGGLSGNCDECEENAEAGWIPEDDPYPNADEPPQHPNCTCTEESREKRVRVYI